MSINSAMLAGVSGLVSNSSALAAISDNIANVNTVGYKRNETNFQDLVTQGAQTGSYSAGGVQAVTQQLVTEQGNMQQTTSSTDLGIVGNGFFVVTNKAENVQPSDARSFTRAGSFTVDSLGYLKNSAGFYLQGWPIDSQGNESTDPSDLTKLQTINIGAVGGTASQTTRASVNANLQASQPLSTYVSGFSYTGVADSASPSVAHNFTVNYTGTGAANQWNVSVADTTTGQTYTGVVTYNGAGAITSSTLPGGSTSTLTLTPGSGATVPLSAIGLTTATDANTQYNPVTNSMAMYNASTGAGVKPDYSLQIPVSDSKGGKRTLEMDFLRSPTPNQWYAEIRAVPASDVQTGPGLSNGQVAVGVVAFTPNGQLDPTNTTLVNPANPVIDFQPSTSTGLTGTQVAWATALGLGDQKISFVLNQAPGGLTQYDSQSITQSINTDGTQFGNLTNVTIDQNGYVTAVFDNGVETKIAQVAIATFPNEDGLKSISGDAYQVSLQSGTYNLKQPGTGGAGAIAPSSLESSTVDLSQEFAGLITAQSAYSASTKIITTADQMMQDLSNVIR